MAGTLILGVTQKWRHSHSKMSRLTQIFLIFQNYVFFTVSGGKKSIYNLIIYRDGLHF